MRIQKSRVQISVDTNSLVLTWTHINYVLHIFFWLLIDRIYRIYIHMYVRSSYRLWLTVHRLLDLVFVLQYWKKVEFPYNIERVCLTGDLATHLCYSQCVPVISGGYRKMPQIGFYSLLCLCSYKGLFSFSHCPLHGPKGCITNKT